MSATITRLPVRETPEPSRLGQELQRIKARRALRLMRTTNQPPRDRYKWRRAAWANGVETCPWCRGAGEVAVPGIYGEYEGTEDCWACRPVLPDLPFDANEAPF